MLYIPGLFKQPHLSKVLLALIIAIPPFLFNHKKVIPLVREMTL